MTRPTVATLLGVAGVLVVGGCGDDGPTMLPADAEFGDPLAGAPPEEVVTKTPTGVAQVLAVDNRFQDDELTVAPGTEVRWVNRGQTDHDVIAVDPAAAFGVPAASLEPGVVYSFVFDEPGEYRYYCSLHGTPDIGMIGTVVVEDPEDPEEPEATATSAAP